jgi:hypothetical protein
MKVLTFQILVRGRLENDPHGRYKFFFEKNYKTIFYEKSLKMVMIKERVKECG